MKKFFVRTLLGAASGAMLLVGAWMYGPQIVDNFETNAVGQPPQGWIHVTESREVTSIQQALEPGETFAVKAEDGNKFLRVGTRNEALRFSQRNGEEFDWSLNEHPRLQWRWRALHLPEGASEKDKNDTGAALYVTFGSDWLGRPKSIKYTYSSSLPVGTVVSFGALHVIVVSSAVNGKIGRWKTVQRRVADDYAQVFGGTPPNRPVSITVWSDSDTTHGRALADFDDIVLLPPFRR
ncbi:DUF3047 domain-containing protein [Salisaeta longa]|uniref:DUF3047 domain-containing protein n=1 Tax=Salisaeta longa TaxID=503170 RepID=UPI000686220B|nr:DUF3047 domain-containing protein [Salisaeta longa]